MRLTLLRYSSQKDDTLGLLFINHEFACYTLGDEHREKKVKGETRIPNGTYKIKLRTEGGFHSRYKRKFPDIHKGMLELQDVPNFKYILIHIGNTDKDTAGCILVGDGATQNITKKGVISSSTSAYKRIYPVIAKAVIEEEEGAIIEVMEL